VANDPSSFEDPKMPDLLMCVFIAVNVITSCVCVLEAEKFIYNRTAQLSEDGGRQR
jgi:hypothetical protein